MSHDKTNKLKWRVNNMSDKKIKLLGVGAHAADVFGRAGGTLARYIKDGHEASIVCLSFGERGEAGDVWKQEGMTMEKVKKIKTEEATNAAKILGVKNLRLMDWDDNPLLIDTKRFYELVDIIRQEKPDIVLTHWLHDWVNWDHATTGEWVARAVWSASRLGVQTDNPPHKVKEVYMFIPSGLSEEVCGFSPDILIDITDVMDLKKKFINAFQSQTEAIPYYTEDYPRYRGEQAGVKYAEAFVRFTKGYKSGSLKYLPCCD
jgi:4-oxalomesaconate hydratase